MTALEPGQEQFVPLELIEEILDSNERTLAPEDAFQRDATVLLHFMVQSTALHQRVTPSFAISSARRL